MTPQETIKEMLKSYFIKDEGDTRAFTDYITTLVKKNIDYQKIEQEFQDWVDAGLWEGEDKYTKNFAVGNVTQWWINKIKEII